MNHHNDELKFFYSKQLMIICRVMLLTLIIAAGYVVSRPSYNFSHWIPHDFIRQIGVPYNTVLWVEQRADVLLHFFGGLILSLLIYASKLPFFKNNATRTFIIVCIFCLAAEILQHIIGRGFDYLDLLLGILGSFMAYLSINKNN